MGSTNQDQAAVTLRPLREEEYAPWAERATADYTDELQRNLGIPAAAAAQRAKADMERLGRKAMEAAEQWAREQGATRMALNVFGDNVVAQSLYRRFGFEVTSVNMAKNLTRP